MPRGWRIRQNVASLFKGDEICMASVFTTRWKWLNQMEERCQEVSQTVYIVPVTNHKDIQLLTYQCLPTSYDNIQYNSKNWWHSRAHFEVQSQEQNILFDISRSMPVISWHNPLFPPLVTGRYAGIVLCINILLYKCNQIKCLPSLNTLIYGAW